MRSVKFQLEDEILDELDALYAKTSIPRIVLVRVAIQRFLEEARAGKLKIGLYDPTQP
jgi:predicted transcriptional regulator